MEQKKDFKSGFVAIVGRPNAGKSTLLNRFVGEKVSIVSPKPQTTRDKIAGIVTEENYQIVFEDTPGVLKSDSKLSRYMKKSIDSAGAETDIILIMLDATKGVRQDDLEIITRFYGKAGHSLILINKKDEAGAEGVFPMIKQLSGMGYENIFAISARTGDSVDMVLDKVIELLPFGEMYYPDDMITDKNKRFMAAEIIREKILYLYQQEIPHGVGINITKFSYDENRNITDIDAEIFCEKPGHKAIIIGKKGEALKKVGEKARIDIERLIETKVFLTMWVKVKDNWRDSDYLLNELGYNKKNM